MARLRAVLQVFCSAAVGTLTPGSYGEEHSSTAVLPAKTVTALTGLCVAGHWLCAFVMLFL